jgi:DNA replication and repair protein RecF
VWLESLELTDFRSYERVTLSLTPGVHALIGENAQGKTNALEAIKYCATGGSHRVAGDAALVRSGAESAVIRAKAHTRSRQLSVEVRLRPKGRNAARLNGAEQPRMSDVTGSIRCVLFAPEDLALVRGEPAERRCFLDELLGQRRPAYAAARAEYDRVLRQRNALLRSMRSSPSAGAGDSLQAWTQALVAAAVPVVAARIAAVHALTEPAAQRYAALAVGAAERGAVAERGRVGLGYRLSTGRCIDGQPGQTAPDPASLAEELQDELARVADDELERGVSLVGPHRDDLSLSLGTLPVKGYASQGEMWSFALALRLASCTVLAEVGEEPVVCLDDVFAELDARRRQRLAEQCLAFEQVIATGAVDADVPLSGPRYEVVLGDVSPVTASEADGGQGDGSASTTHDSLRPGGGPNGHAA